MLFRMQPLCPACFYFFMRINNDDDDDDNVYQSTCLTRKACRTDRCSTTNTTNSRITSRRNVVRWRERSELKTRGNVSTIEQEFEERQSPDAVTRGGAYDEGGIQC